MGAAAAQRVPAADWFCTAGPDNDVVVSTRCRLARNVARFVFPDRADHSQLNAVSQACARALIEVQPTAVKFDRPRLLPEQFRDLIVGRYASFRWAARSGPGSISVEPDGFRSVMVNEEDHLRIQAIGAGCRPERVLEAAASLEEALGRRLPFAHRGDVGYLTSSLSNAGTGLRLSFLLHVPALARQSTYLEVLAAAESMGCSVRGAFGEGTSGTGALVQLSNRCTFGAAAAHSVDRAISAATYLVEREREARGAFLAMPAARADIRAAVDGARERLLAADLQVSEMLRCLSVVRLGIALGATTGDLVRIGEWLALAGAALWAKHSGGAPAERFERTRCIALIRAGLRASG